MTSVSKMKVLWRCSCSETSKSVSFWNTPDKSETVELVRVGVDVIIPMNCVQRGINSCASGYGDAIRESIWFHGGAASPDYILEKEAKQNKGCDFVLTDVI